MEKAVLEKIGVLRRAYKEKEQAYEVEYEKLQAYVEKYLDENNIWGNKELLGDVVQILPDSKFRFRLIDYLYDLQDKETEQKTDQEAAPKRGRDMGRHGVCGMPRHDPKALMRIKWMVETYREKKQEFWAEQKKLQEYVNGYLDQYGIRNDLAKLNELADVLPGGIVRFRLLETICLLKEKVEGIGMDISEWHIVSKYVII